MLKVANKAAVLQPKTMPILQFHNQAQLQIFLKNRVFVSNEAFYLILTLFAQLHKCQFVNNRPLFFIIHSEMQHKKVGNQIYHGRLGVYVLKIESAAVDWIFMT